MSSLLATDSDILFKIRADHDQLRRDLRTMDGDVGQFVSSVNAQLATIKSSSPPIAIPPEVKADLSAVNEQLETIKASADGAAVSMRAIGTEADAASQATKGIADSANATTQAVEGTTRSAFRLGQAFLIARAAADGLKAAADGIDLAKAVGSGDLSKVEAAKAILKKDLEDFPLAGPIGKQAGRVSDDLTPDISILGALSAARQFVRDHSSRRNRPQESGTMSDEEIADFDQQQAELKIRLDKREVEAREVEARNNQERGIVRASQRAEARDGKSPTEVAALDAQNRLDDFNRGIADRPVTGKALSADDQDAKKALESGVRDAQSKDATAKIDDAKKGIENIIAVGEKFANELAGKVAKAAEDQVEANANLKELQERNAGDVDAAEKTHLEESIRRKLDAAAKVGDFQVAIVQQVAEEERKELEHNQEERRQKEAENEAESEAHLAAEAAKEEKDRARQIEDLHASAEDKFLRRTGEGQQADANEITRRAQRAVDDATGDQEKQQAILANAEQDILGLKADRPQVADVITSTAASMLNLLGGDAGSDDQTDIAKQSLEQLKIIARNAGVAVTGP